MTLGDVVVVRGQYPQDVLGDQLEVEAAIALRLVGPRDQDHVVVVPPVAHAPDRDRTLGDVDPAVPDRPVRHRILGDVFALVLDREVACGRCRSVCEREREIRSRD